MSRRLLALALILPLAGCDLNSLVGKPSAFQVAQERRDALKPAVDLAIVEAVEAGTVEVPVAPQPEPTPEPTPAPYVAPCVDVYRVTRCTDGVAGEWGW